MKKQIRCEISCDYHDGQQIETIFQVRKNTYFMA